MNKDNKQIDYGNAFEVLKEGLRKSEEKIKSKTQLEIQDVCGAYAVLVAHAEKTLEMIAPDPNDIPEPLFQSPKAN